MSDDVVQVVRYPNRRFYDRRASKYVSLRDIEALVRSGSNLEIRDSQTDEDLTRSVLTRIIMEHQPEKMRLFPVDMLHQILRSNDVMTDFLKDYFRQSLTYLSYLQQHGATASKMTQPMHWVKAWLDGIAPAGRDSGNPSAAIDGSLADVAAENGQFTSPNRDELVRRVAQLEQRLRMLEDGGGQEGEQSDRQETGSED